MIWLVCLQCVVNMFDICVIASDRLLANHQGTIYMEKRGRVKNLSKKKKSGKTRISLVSDIKYMFIIILGIFVWKVVV